MGKEQYNMTDGFKKLEIRSGKRSSGSKGKSSPLLKIIGIIAILIIVFLLGSAGLLYMLGRDAYASFLSTKTTAGEAYTSLKNKDLETGKMKLKETEDKLLLTQQKLAPVRTLKILPFAGAYFGDIDHLISAAIAGVQAGEIAVETVIPYADLLGFKGKSSFVSGSADERIAMAVTTLDKMIPKVDDISIKLAVVKKELDSIDPERYPEKIGSTTVRSKIIGYKEIFDQSAKLFVDAQPLLKQLPDLAGLHDTRRYLVLFQNDAELRATGGFLTAYAVFKIDKGKMQVEKAEDIYKLDAAKNKQYPAPAPILKYHLNVNNFQLRDSNISPDYEESMKTFEKMLSESVPGFPSYNGIIALDTHVLVSAIKVLGDFNVYGRSFTAANDPRCNCPKAIYELEDYSTKPVAYIRDERKDIIGALMYQIMQRALGVSPSKYWGQLMQVFLTEAQQKHVLFYFHDSNAQKGVESLAWGGRVMPTKDFDYLHIVNVNFAGAKSNLFIRDTVKQEITVAGDGSVEKKVTVTYKNPAKPSNCNLEAGQLCLNGVLRNWVRFYVPEGSTLIDFTGSEMKTQTYNELGKTVFEGFLKVNPEGMATISVRYKLPNKFQGSGPYTMFIQKQAGTDSSENTVSYKGRQVADIKLLTDQELSFK